MIPARLGVWPTLPPRAYLRATRPELPFPLGLPGTTVYARARVGLYHALRALELAPEDEILVPAYHHGSEVEAIVRAGLTPRFYASLWPGEEELDALRSPATRALYLVHTLGLPHDGARWRRWCDERGLLLVEDAAQAWLATSGGVPVGSHGDVAVFCLYKTYGVPDGSAVHAPALSLPRPEPGGAGVAPLLRRHASRELGRSHLVEELVRRSRGDAPTTPAAEFSLGDLSAGPSRASLALLQRVADPADAGRRRQRYEHLLHELGELAPPEFRDVPEGAAPFAFAIETDDKAELIARLDDARITPLDFWSFPHPALPAEGFDRSAQLRDRVVAVPTHQDLTRADVERIVRTVRPRAPRRPLALARVEPAGVRAEWEELAARSGNVFVTPEWLLTWWRHFGGERELLLTACRGADGDLVALLPLYAWKERPLRVLRFLGHGPSDELGPVCAPTDQRAAAHALRSFPGEWDVLLAEQLRGDLPWQEELGGRLVRRTGFPVLELGAPDWETFLAGRSANFRGTLRRKERALEREHDVTYRLADPTTFDDDFATLVRLHDLRWAGHDSPFTGDRVPFHAEFARLALERGWLRLWLLELDGEPAAAWYGLRFGGADGYYQAGRDPARERLSLGYLLLMHSIRDALESGMSRYLFLRGDEAYKYRFASLDPGLEIRALGRGPVGTAAVRAGLAAYGSPRLRRVLRAPLGA